MNPDIKSILLSEEEISEVTDRIAAEIDRDYENSGYRLLLVGILKGSMVFMSDLIRRIKLPIEIDFMRVSSYGSDTVSNGRPHIILDLPRKNISNCDILIVEDIIDSGNTLSYLTEYLALGGAHSVKTCTLLDKPQRRIVNIVPDYAGVQIPDEFVVGYGLDYAEKYRNLPYIGILKPSVYQHG